MKNKILVLDVPAEKGGAITILNEHYDKAKSEKESLWVFILGRANLQETDNVSVIRFPWVKKSWFHRIYFDKLVLRKLLTEQNPDEVISLQNTFPKGIRSKKTLYVHQALPFSDYKFNILSESSLWVHRNIISLLIIRSIKQSTLVVVQTQWMKQKILERTSIPESRILIDAPALTNRFLKTYSKRAGKTIFFYPATPFSYKNHKIILEALQTFNQDQLSKVEVIFTITGEENKISRKIAHEVNKNQLPVRLIGNISYEEIYRYYSNSILLFPSVLESYGLPLAEARNANSPVIASDTPFAREILHAYDQATFLTPDSPGAWANEILKKAINK